MTTHNETAIELARAIADADGDRQRIEHQVDEGIKVLEEASSNLLSLHDQVLEMAESLQSETLAEEVTAQKREEEASERRFSFYISHPSLFIDQKTRETFSRYEECRSDVTSWTEFDKVMISSALSLKALREVFVDPINGTISFSECPEPDELQFRGAEFDLPMDALNGIAFQLMEIEYVRAEMGVDND